MTAKYPNAADALTKFKQAQAKIEEIKQRRRHNAIADAREALGKLDKASYAYLVSTLDPDEPPSRT